MGSAGEEYGAEISLERWYEMPLPRWFPQNSNKGEWIRGLLIVYIFLAWFYVVGLGKAHFFAFGTHWDGEWISYPLMFICFLCFIFVAIFLAHERVANDATPRGAMVAVFVIITIVLMTAQFAYAIARGLS